MLLTILIYFILSLFIGAIATLITGFSRTGCIVKIIIGFIGMLLGYILTTRFNLPDFFTIELASRNIPLLWSLICAILFVSIISIFRGR
jgi:uncharacterized membrane protein YeaQ/YmgE (transglycosylase-associated protein family)